MKRGLEIICFSPLVPQRRKPGLLGFCAEDEQSSRDSNPGVLMPSLGRLPLNTSLGGSKMGIPGAHHTPDSGIWPVWRATALQPTLEASAFHQHSCSQERPASLQLP